MRKEREEKIELACLQHAIDSYVCDDLSASDWMKYSFEEKELALSNISIWEPFETHPYDFIINQIGRDTESVKNLVMSTHER